MSYNPYRQGRRDGLHGKPRHQHQSAWNSGVYNRAYDEASKERELMEARERKHEWDGNERRSYDRRKLDDLA